MNDIASCRSLWLAVLGLALSEASKAPDPRRKVFLSNHHQSKVYHERQRARHWLLNNNVDFRSVCSLAGLDPEWVRGQFVDEETGRLLQPGFRFAPHAAEHHALGTIL